ncbi:MAG TPA: ornithine cyclodeaminase family protein [Candidatus Dormibacteraeota bacterium]|jgi:ornithine cyclodeaminase
MAGGAPSLSLRYLSGKDVERLNPAPSDVIEAVQNVLRAQGSGEVVLEPRVHLEPGGAFRGHWNVLRAYVNPLGTAGVKVVGDFVDNFRLGLPSELGLLTLYDPRTGAPVAVIDAADLTARRTGALTAVGAKYLARRDARVLAHVGARGTAFWNVTMLASLFDFEEIRVTSLRRESREEFGRMLERSLGRAIRVVDTPREAIEGADIVVEATRLVEPEPILRTAWVAPGALVVPYGTVSAVELDLLSIMDKVVVDDWGQCKAGGRFGALRPHVERGLLNETTLHAEIADVVVGRRPGRERNDERIVFWHRGLATCDVALGSLLLERAVESGVGTVLPYR